MRGTLEFAREAPELEPTSDFTAQLLLAAQNERRVVQSLRARHSVTVRVLQGLGYAAGILLVSALCFGAALSVGRRAPEVPVAASAPASDPGSSPEAIRRTSAEIQALASAVSAPSKRPPNLWELEQRRAVHSLDDEIEAARSALERNPGCERASRMVDSNLKRQAQTLRTLYVERSL
jgi:hypothetical protein